MRASTTIIVATLSLFTLLASATASAEPATVQVTSQPLGMAIAMQGDNALVSIQRSAADSISQSIRDQMAASLPQHQVTTEAPANPGVADATELAALTSSH